MNPGAAEASYATRPEVVRDHAAERRDADNPLREDTALRVTAIACFVLTGGSLAALVYSIIALLGQLAGTVRLPGSGF